MNIQLATVKYQVTTYKGEATVNCFPSDPDEHIISKAKKRVRRESGGSFPFGYQKWEVIKREDIK